VGDVVDDIFVELQASALKVSVLNSIELVLSSRHLVVVLLDLHAHFAITVSISERMSCAESIGLTGK
jgi:hypothetical protein